MTQQQSNKKLLKSTYAKGIFKFYQSCKSNILGKSYGDYIQKCQAKMW